MLQWTGEQFLPTIKDALTVYLHVHRYVYASGFVKGKRVLDIAAGEGYGSSILADTADSVVGIVPDEAIARYAGERYRKPNLQFLVSFPSDDRFDAVLCLDPSELKLDQTSLLIEYKRFVKPGGLFILSSQNAQAEEFRAFVATGFKHVQIFGQRIYGNSSIWPVSDEEPKLVSELVMSRNSADEFQRVAAGQRMPSSLIAIASDSRVSVRGTGSVFIDEANELLEDKEKALRELNATRAYQAAALKSLEDQVAGRRESLASLQEAFAWHKSQIEALTRTREYLEGEIAQFRNAIASNEEAMAWRTSQVADLEKGIQSRDEAIGYLQNRIQLLEEGIPWRSTIENLEKELGSIRASRGWKFVMQIRAFRDRLPGSLRRFLP